MLIRLIKLLLWCRQRRENSREGKRERGVKYCRHAGYGFKWGPDGRRVPDPAEAAVIARIVEMK